MHVPKTATRETVECNRYFPAAVTSELTLCRLSFLRKLSFAVRAVLKKPQPNCLTDIFLHITAVTIQFLLLT